MSKNYMNDSQASEIMKFISDTMKFPIMGAGGGFAPIGVGNWYMGSVAPQGWLICDGTIYNIADYPEFAAFIASNYGSTNAFGGDGITTFAVPDCRGEYFRMIGENSHANQGDGGELGEHQDATQQNVLYEGSQIGVFAMDSYGQYCANADSRSDIDGQYVAFSKNSTGTSTGFPTVTSRPTTTCWNFIVKATLSDAEINAFNVYTPREHQVAWWEEEIDGVWKRKPVYERTITKLSITLSDRDYVTVFSQSQYDIDKVISAVGFTTDKTFPLCIRINSGKVQLFMSAMGTYIVNTLVIEYTKSTDDWQTS